MSSDLVDATPLDEYEFYSLYLEGLTLGGEEYRLKSAYVLLLAGRLGLRPDEIRHLHEGWIDWRRGEIRVPRFDPCACETCWERARARQRSGPRPLSEIVSEETWSPPTEAGARSIPFGYSERLVAVLATFLDEEAYLDMTAAEMERLLAATAENATGIDPESVSMASVRASAATFFADTGLRARGLAGVLGTDVETAATFVRRTGGHARAELHGEFDESGVTLPPDAYRLVRNPAPFEREPFDPRAFDSDARRRLAEERAATARIGTPRPPSPPDGVEYDPDRHRVPGHADPASDAVSRPADGTPSRLVTLREWVSLHEGERRVDVGSDGERETAGRETKNATGGGSRTTTGESERPETSARRGGDPSPATGTGDSIDREDGPESLPPRERVTNPIVEEVSTNFAVSDVDGGAPKTGRVLLGQAELLFDPDEGESFLLSLERISDVAIGYAPSALENAFRSPVGIAYRVDGDRRIAVVDLPGTHRRTVSTALFERTLDGEEVVVTHPAKVGGRVTDAVSRRFTLSVTSDRLTLTAEDADDVEIRLSDVIDVERGYQDVDGERWRSLQVTYLEENRTLTTLVGAADPARGLLERFLELDYRQRRRRLRSISLSSEEKDLLVALHSTDGDAGLTAVMDRSPGEIQEIIDSLDDHGLVRTDDGTTLTGTGRMAVADEIEDVNA